LKASKEALTEKLTIQRTCFPCFIPYCILYFPVHFTVKCSGIYSKTDLENPGEKKTVF